MHLLHVDSSVLGDDSVSRKVSAAIVASLRSADPGASVTYRDLAARPLAHLSGRHLVALAGAEAADLRADIDSGQAALEEFLAADVVVVGAPMYNFTLPTQLKAWIDRLLIAGRTFRYGPDGPQGLAGGKRVIVAVSRGGFYGPSSPNAGAEHLESYLRTVFGFIGVTDLEFVAADGIRTGQEQRERALAQALGAAERLRAA
ncbi:MAG TPA: NAD(P)H-dependent oxidoreductase [Caulobacteraceae bacterium]|nr:NAD(P)H-dependent oxidoreductase [Caulobacteraceae bacterium]